MASSTASDLSQEDASSMASADPSEVVVTLLEQHAPHVILQLGAALAVATSGRRAASRKAGVLKLVILSLPPHLLPRSRLTQRPPGFCQASLWMICKAVFSCGWNNGDQDQIIDRHPLRAPGGGDHPLRQHWTRLCS